MAKAVYHNQVGINFDAPVLCSAESGEPVRNATVDEATRSREAKASRPGADRGVIEIDGGRYYVIEWPETAAGPDRRVAGPGLD